jgi:hypothetical protein
MREPELAMPFAFFAFAATITLLWGGAMIALLIGFRRQRQSPDALASVRPLTLLDDARFIA